MKRFLFIILIFAILPAVAQTSSESDNAIKKALAAGRMLTQERVYLNFDNSTYYLGETMWFKAHVTCGNYDIPSKYSKILYVELVAPEGYVVETKKYKLDNEGCCHGEFELKPLLLSGYYEIRAYTRYMLNRGSAAVFSRVFPIFDKVNGDNWDFKNMLDRRRGFMKNGTWVNSELPDCALDFYPEGGHLVESIPTLVAFELRTIDGAFGNDTITIYEDKKPLLTTVPVHNGKGTFSLFPKSTSKYHAEVYAKNQKGKREKFEFELPQIEKQGVSIHVENDSANITFTITNNYPEATEIGFALMYRGSMGFYHSYPSAEKRKRFTVAKNDLYEGVTCATVFTGETPLAERLFFVRHNETQRKGRQTVKLNVKANDYLPHNATPGAHEKITITVERDDSLPIDPNAHFSIAVTDAAGNSATSWDYNMYTYLLLGSELKGYIPNAGQYFDTQNKERDKQLDLIMLTQGWTSYDWSKLISLDFKDMQPVERSITIKGHLYEKRKNEKFGELGTFLLKPEADNLISLKISYDNKDIEQSVFRTDSTGGFLIDLADFYGKRTGVLTPTRRFVYTDEVWYGFSLDRYYSPEFRLYNYWERNLGTSQQYTANDAMIKISPFEYLLSSVEVVADKKEERNGRPPHSEMRFDYLEEWEYAQDVTFLLNSSIEDELSAIETDEEYLNEIHHDEHEQWRSENEEDLDPYEREESKEIDILDTYKPSGIFELSSKSQHGKYIGRIHYRGGLESGRNVGTRDYINNKALTAEDVVKSAMYRHNYNWAYWVQLMAVAGEYDPYNIPTPDTDYYKGKEIEKMVNFKEIAIRSDIPTREQFKNIDTQWGRKTNALNNKEPFTKFYLGFLSQTYLTAKEGVDGAPMPEIFLERLKQGQVTEGSSRSYPYHPNYVACLIPYKDEDTVTTKIIPDFLGKGSVRYTSVRGYDKSKKFYSPNYSSIKPDAAEKDYRRTLLWEPSARAIDGKLTLSLFNSTQCRAIKVSVNGVSQNTFYSNDDITCTRVADDTAAKEQSSSESQSDAGQLKAPTDPELLASLAYEYETGEIYYNQRKYHEAVKRFAELIQYNYPPAYHIIGVCYLHGRGVSQRDDKAAEFFEVASELGSAPGMYELSQLCKSGRGIEKDEAKAFMLLQKAAELDEPRAQTELGRYYIDGIIVDKDSTKAMELLRKAALSGNADGLYYYGLCMHKSGITDSELGTSLNCINKATTMQQTDALLFMMHHYDALGQYKDAYDRAHKLHQLGIKEGTLYMAECYEQGRGVKRDKRLAKDLRREAGTGK